MSKLIKNIFVGSSINLNLEDSDFAILGVPFEKTVFYRKGCRFGPKKIREVSQQMPMLTENGINLLEKNIVDLGDIKANSVKEMIKRVEDKLKEIYSLNITPVLIGGEHLITYPAVKAYPKDLCLICFDAHPDLFDNFKGEKYSHATVMRRILEEKIRSKNLIYIGLRSFEQEEREFMEKHKILFLDMDILKQKELVEEFLSEFKNKPVYVSIDIDVLDPAFAPGTGIPDPGGLSTRELLDLLSLVAKLKVIGFDLVEVSPPLDKSDITSFAAAKIIIEFMGKLKK